MDVINKFYSTVHTTVSQLSGVLPGNNVTREYEVLDQVCTAGVGLLWKVYNGFKKSTKQEVSVFVFEKKVLDRWSKEDREAILETLRRGVQQLTKIRHPHVLTVQHPLEESRDSLAFATEPVFASLANVVGDQVRPEKKLYDVEIRHGLLQLFDGLQFLHNDAKIVHRNICAETIVINKNRSWKLFGFDFCVVNQPQPDGKPYWPCKEYSTSIHMLAQPTLEYTAPEIALNNINSTDSDLFALGILIFTIYAGKPLKIFGSDYSAFRRYANELNQRKYPPMNAVPSELTENLKALLHPSPHLRPKLHDLREVTYFHDVGVKTLSYLDSLYQWDNLQKSKFYKGLPQIIPTLPHRVNLHSILPYLVKEFVNSPMIPFVLPNVLLIAEMSSQKEYCDHILPHLKPIFKLTEPIQILLVFMQKMDLLLKLTPAEEVKLHVLPLLYRSLECDMPQIQELCLNVLPTFSTLIDYNAMKNSLIPRIKKLCLTSTNVSVRVNCLISIGKLLENLDKWLVLDEILPFLQQIQSREPAIIMAIIGIYKIAMTNTKLGITKDVMAHKCIPFLIPLSVENGLTIAQFNAIVTLIKEMFLRVEKEQREKLEQLSTIQRDNKPKDASEILTSELDKSSASRMSTSNDDDMFSGFSLSNKPQQSSASQSKLGPKPMQLTKQKEQLKISHNSTHKPDILSSLMTNNLSNMGNNGGTKPQETVTASGNTSHSPFSSSGSIENNWQQTSWYSANPLVMNHQMPPPTTATPNTNVPSLDDLDAFGNMKKTTKQQMGMTNTTTANTFTLQKPTVDYIYPPGYNNAKINAHTPLMGSNLGNNGATKPQETRSASGNTSHSPFSSSGNVENNWQQTSWHSANPLVMNHQMPPPTAATPNNNLSSLDDLDPFGNMKKTTKQQMGMANTFTLQKPTVDYIYPPGYNNVKINAHTPLMANNLGNNGATKPQETVSASGNTSHSPFSSSGSIENTWQQTSWHSANPLVMNHQMPPPTAATPNNNLSSLDDLDPFGNMKKTTKQQMGMANTTTANTLMFL